MEARTAARRKQLCLRQLRADGSDRQRGKGRDKNLRQRKGKAFKVRLLYTALERL